MILEIWDKWQTGPNVKVCATKLIQRQQQSWNGGIHYQWWGLSETSIPINSTNVALEQRKKTTLWAGSSSLTQHEVKCTDSRTSLLHSTDLNMPKPYSSTYCRQHNTGHQKAHPNPVKHFIFSWSKTNAHIPTFFFLLHVNVWESIAVPFQNPLSQDLFMWLLMPCLYCPF